MKDGTQITIPLLPLPDCIPYTCHGNVARVISRWGGERVKGWERVTRGPMLAEEAFHSVWLAPTGSVWDVTPKTVLTAGYCEKYSIEPTRFTVDSEIEEVEWLHRYVATDPKAAYACARLNATAHLGLAAGESAEQIMLELYGRKTPNSVRAARISDWNAQAECNVRNIAWAIDTQGAWFVTKQAREAAVKRNRLRKNLGKKPALLTLQTFDDAAAYITM